MLVESKIYIFFNKLFLNTENTVAKNLNDQAVYEKTKLVSCFT